MVTIIFRSVYHAFHCNKPEPNDITLTKCTLYPLMAATNGRYRDGTVIFTNCIGNCKKLSSQLKRWIFHQRKASAIWLVCVEVFVGTRLVFMNRFFILHKKGCPFCGTKKTTIASVSETFISNSTGCIVVHHP